MSENVLPIIETIHKLEIEIELLMKDSLIKERSNKKTSLIKTTATSDWTFQILASIRFIRVRTFLNCVAIVKILRQEPSGIFGDCI